eukprot:1865068-Pyramimonas_sp.AAC.1
MLGENSRASAEAVQVMRPESIPGWPISGPRTCKLLSMQLVRLGYTGMQRQLRWRQVLAVTTDDP